MPSYPLRLGGLFFLVSCLLLVGCSPRMVQVSGTVKYKEKPLTQGAIQFLGSDGASYAGTIGSDGTYSAKVPTGEAKVSISCIDEAAMVKDTKAASDALRESLKSGKQAPRPKGRKTYSLIPEKYADFSESGLTVTIKDSSPLNFTLD